MIHMRIAPVALIASLAIVVVGCAGDSVNAVLSTPFSSSGQFVLQAINGNLLPVVISFDAVDPRIRNEVTSSTLTLNGTGFESSTALRQTVLGVILETFTVRCIGTFTATGDDVTFVEEATSPDCGRTFHAQTINGTLRATIDGDVYLYQLIT